MNYFLIGPMGAGKSSVGKMLASKLGLSFYDTDQEIVNKCGVDINWIFDVEGEDGFRRREHGILEEFSQKQNIVLATGGGIITHPENHPLLVSRGTVIHLKVSLDQQLTRTKRTDTRPVLARCETPEDVKALYEAREPVYDDLADWTFHTDECSVGDIVYRIIKRIDNND